MVDYLVAGECGLVVQFGNIIDESVNSKVHFLARFLNGAKRPPGVEEVIPTYRSLLVCFNPLIISRQQLTDIIDKYLQEYVLLMQKDFFADAGRTVEIPVCYGGEFGTDLADVAKNNGLAEQEVIERHCAQRYKVYMLGFLPGFAYLGGLDESIACPRLPSPRTKIASGSVGIAGNQTGIYPLESPGGWRLIGRTPVALFAPSNQQPFFLQPGDTVTFRPIKKEEYELLLARGTVEKC